MKTIKYFIEFLSVLSLFVIFKILGLKTSSNLGSILGMLAGPFFRSKKITKKNIETALGILSKKQEGEIIKVCGQI